MRHLWHITTACLLVIGCAHAATTADSSRRVDEFGDVCCDDEKARLDNFAIELQKEPHAAGYIVFYGGRLHSDPPCQRSRLRLPRRREAEARAWRLKHYLVDTRGVAHERIVVIDGGYRERWTAELWIVPGGATPPSPSPTVKREEIRFRKGRAVRRDYICEI